MIDDASAASLARAVQNNPQVDDLLLYGLLD
jgi:hypothetical protein